MKRISLLFLALFGLAHGTFAFVPITEFNPGHYSGQGTWLGQDGSTGDFKTFLDLESSGWVVAKFMLGDLYVYETNLQIDNNGFAFATMIDASDPSNPGYYYGFGNCGTSYCQVSIELNNGIMQKALIFKENGNVEYVGAIYFNDGTPNMQWEGRSVRLP